MDEKDIKIVLSAKEALVLGDWIFREMESCVKDKIIVQILHNIECDLEASSPEVLSEGYGAKIDHARKKLEKIYFSNDE